MKVLMSGRGATGFIGIHAEFIKASGFNEYLKVLES
jgi:hypothetical protein